LRTIVQAECILPFQFRVADCVCSRGTIVCTCDESKDVWGCGRRYFLNLTVVNVAAGHSVDAFVCAAYRRVAPRGSLSLLPYLTKPQEELI
jgi:hypothetical protein